MRGTVVGGNSEFLVRAGGGVDSGCAERAGELDAGLGDGGGGCVPEDGVAGLKGGY